LPAHAAPRVHAFPLFDVLRRPTSLLRQVDEYEAQVLVLAIYLKLNRQAPVEPPSRETVAALFKAADKDKSGCLTKEEFSGLATSLCAAAFARVASYKCLQILCAPLLAAYIAKKVCGEIVCETICKSESGRTISGLKFSIISNLKLILTIVFVVSLGKNVLNLVDLFLGYAKRNKQAGEAPAAAGKQKK